MAALQSVEPLTHQSHSSLEEPPRRKLGFLDLPAELRTQIYELVFTPTLKSSKYAYYWVLLFDSRPPDKSLLSVCRAVYQEARSLYKHAYRDYWSITRFCIYTRVSDLNRIYADEDNDENFSHIRYFRTLSKVYGHDFEMLSNDKGIGWVRENINEEWEFGFVDGRDYGGFKCRHRGCFDPSEPEADRLLEFGLDDGWFGAPLREQLLTIHEEFGCFGEEDDGEDDGKGQT